MRPTWIVVGLVVVVGGVAYLKLRERADELERGGAGAAAGTNAPGTPGGRAASGGAVALEKGASNGVKGPAVDPVPGGAAGTGAAGASDALETHARALLGEVARAQEKKDRAAYDAAVARLEKEAWDAPSARRYAVRLGEAEASAAARLAGLERVQRLDHARRLLSRGVWLPEMFDAKNQPTDARAHLVQSIQDANREVMTWARREGGGLAGVTRPYTVPPGEAPLVTVSRQHLPYGPNALLYWNKGTLDPKRVQAGETLLLPEETLHVEVSIVRRRLAIFLGGWLVKDFAVGVGRSETPTPRGAFHVGKKRQRNPDWYPPNRAMVPYGDPRNELGAAWIGIESDQVPESAGFGVHGTNRPDTVGTECSNGCVRLLNENATEVYRWIRGVDSNGGKPTEIRIF